MYDAIVWRASSAFSTRTIVSYVLLAGLSATQQTSVPWPASTFARARSAGLAASDIALPLLLKFWLCSLRELEALSIHIRSSMEYSSMEPTGVMIMLIPRGSEGTVDRRFEPYHTLTTPSVLRIPHHHVGKGRSKKPNKVCISNVLAHGI